MFVLPKSCRRLALLAGVVVVAACQEDLTGGAACPSLCPEQELQVRDTVLVAEEIVDTLATLSDVPSLGTDSHILLANYAPGGEPVRTVGVFRFDSLFRFVADTNPEAPPRYYDRVDTVTFAFRLLQFPPEQDTAWVRDSVTVDILDLTVGRASLDTAAVRARLSEPPIATLRLSADTILKRGQITVPLDTGFFASRLRAGQPIHLGIRVSSAPGVRLPVGTQEGGSPAFLQYVAYADTARRVENVTVNSMPVSGVRIPALADFMLVEAGTVAPPAGTVAVGGLPASRVFLRFALPAALVDSNTTIVRANLELPRAANPRFAASDSLLVYPRVVRAKPAVTEVAKAALLAADPTFLDLVRRAPVAEPHLAAVDTIPLVDVFRFWRVEGPETFQRAIVLQSGSENVDPRQVLYYSTQAPEALRPRLRLSYIPRSGFGLP